MSTAFTGAGGLGFVQDTLEFFVNFSADLSSADLTALQNATWWVEFGSSGYFLCAGPDPRCPRVAASEPASLALMGTALVGVVAAAGLARRRRPA
ncbi:MAG: PEP-CTERM sorting domain-containing protein [Armatimonadetes bacterium]|nr:PEP-CTERM sorting domain-containing protein [Armatimonadota bacterium]MDW8153924.1 PEP-CTERM sorting domain-containing protein [Armatimonadota bacterium]